MEGAPLFKEQPKGPFARRKWFNQIVVFCKSLALMEVKGGGKFIYGDNKVILDLTAQGGDIPVTLCRNGQAWNYTLKGTDNGAAV